MVNKIICCHKNYAALQTLNLKKQWSVGKINCCPESKIYIFKCNKKPAKDCRINCIM